MNQGRLLVYLTVICAFIALACQAAGEVDKNIDHSKTDQKKNETSEQEFVYGFFRKDCYESSDFFTYENRCLQHSATKILGYGVIVACLVFKVP